MSKENEVPVFVCFCNEPYERFLPWLLKSMDIWLDDYVMVCYGLDYEPKIRHNRVVLRRMSSKGYANPSLLKPAVLLDMLHRGFNEYVFIDIDSVIGRRFSIDMVRNTDLNYPIGVLGPWPIIVRWTIDLAGNRTDYNEVALFSYFGMSSFGARSIDHVTTNLLAVNAKCTDFLEEWMSICANGYFNKHLDLYLTFTDETAYNLVMNRRRLNRTLPRVCLNAFHYDAVEVVETNDDIEGEVLGRGQSRVDRSSQVGIYHAVKSDEDLALCLELFAKEARS